MENSFRKDNLTLSPFSFLSRIGIIRECCKTLDEELRPPESILLFSRRTVTISVTNQSTFENNPRKLLFLILFHVLVSGGRRTKRRIKLERQKFPLIPKPSFLFILQ